MRHSGFVFDKISMAMIRLFPSLIGLMMLSRSCFQAKATPPKPRLRTNRHSGDSESVDLATKLKFGRNFCRSDFSKSKSQCSWIKSISVFFNSFSRCGAFPLIPSMLTDVMFMLDSWDCVILEGAAGSWPGTKNAVMSCAFQGDVEY